MTDIFTFHLVNPQDARPRKIELFVFANICLCQSLQYEHPHTSFKHSCLIFNCLHNMLSQKISNLGALLIQGLVKRRLVAWYTKKLIILVKLKKHFVSWED